MVDGGDGGGACFLCYWFFLSRCRIDMLGHREENASLDCIHILVLDRGSAAGKHVSFYCLFRVE